MTATPPGANENFWWLEIATDEPYLYIFGPFDSKEEAEGASGRYISDLVEEGWKITANSTTRQVTMSE